MSTLDRRSIVYLAAGAFAAIVAPYTFESKLTSINDGVLRSNDALGVAWAAKRLESAFYAAAVRSRAVSDPILVRHMREVAADKAWHMALLSSHRPPPALRLDLSPAPFSAVARAAGLRPANEIFAPFASDIAVVIGAVIVEQSCAATYRCLHAMDGPEAEALAPLVADAGYHAGLMRTSLEARGAGQAADKVAALFAGLTAAGTADEGEMRHAVNGLLLGHGARGRGGFFPAGLSGSDRRAA